MRTNKELLQLIKKEIKRCSHPGLCSANSSLLMFYGISHPEFMKVARYIRKNRPKETIEASAYWFKKGVKAPRIRWLDEHINKV